MIIGVDLGTQAIKVLALDSKFQLLGRSTIQIKTRFPKPGWAEQNPQDWEIALRQGIKQAIAAINSETRKIRAVGITGQLDGCIAINQDGVAISPCLIWIDRRAEFQLDQTLIRFLREEQGINPDPSHMAAKARWLLDNGSINGERVIFHQPVSYMVQRLTGKHILDHSLASTTMLYSLNQKDYDAKLLEAFGLTKTQFPAIGKAESVAGLVSPSGALLSGIPKGTPIAVGTGDDFCSPLGAGVTKPGTVACVIGTAEVIGALSNEPRIDSQGLLETHPFPGGQFFVENPGWYSGGSVSWFLKTFRLSDFMAFDQLAAEAPAGSDELLFLPALNGAMTPEWIPSARGCFYGISPNHTTGHFARALLEGCAFAMKDVIDRLEELGVSTERILLMGGGAASKLWATIRATVSRRPVFQVPIVDTAPIGAAMLAAVAIGTHSSLDHCANFLPQWKQPIKGESTKFEVYDSAYQSYRRLFESLRPMY